MLVVLDDKGDVITLNGRGAAMLDEEGLVSSNRPDVLTCQHNEEMGWMGIGDIPPGGDRVWGGEGGGAQRNSVCNHHYLMF